MATTSRIRQDTLTIFSIRCLACMQETSIYIFRINTRLVCYATFRTYSLSIQYYNPIFFIEAEWRTKESTSLKLVDILMYKIDALNAMKWNVFITNVFNSIGGGKLKTDLHSFWRNVFVFENFLDLFVYAKNELYFQWSFEVILHKNKLTWNLCKWKSTIFSHCNSTKHFPKKN